MNRKSIGVAGSLCLIFFLVLTFLMIGDHLTGFDQPVIQAVQGFESSSLTPVMKAFTWIGSTKVVAGLALIIAVWLWMTKKFRPEALLVAGILAGTGILNVLLKNVFHRPRPELHRLIAETGYSFPSGHSMGAMALYGVLIFLIWHHVQHRGLRFLLILACAAMVLLIGLSRIYLGVHYPSDVLAGYLVSGCLLSVAFLVFAARATRRPPVRGNLNVRG